MNDIPDTVLALLKASYDDACARHPEYPKDRFHQLALIGEEKGEADKDANENANKSHYVMELSHIAVTCIRAMMRELEGVA